MKRNPEPDENWTSCPPGLIKAESERLQLRRRRRFLMASAAGAIGLSAAFLSIMNRVNRPVHIGPTPQWIPCSQFRENLDDYLQQRIKDSNLLSAMQFHSEHCPPCLKLLRQKCKGAHTSYV